MSHLLDQAAKQDAQRREDLAREDAALVASMFPLETAHGIKRTGPAKVGGNHLSAQNDEPSLEYSEDELIQADLDYLRNRDRRFRKTLAVVHELELEAFRRQGWL